jgi:hypothetical protein
MASKTALLVFPEMQIAMVMLRLFLQEGKDNSLLPIPLSRNGVALLVAFLCTKRRNFWLLGNTCAVTFLVLSVLALIVIESILSIVIRPFGGKCCVVTSFYHESQITMDFLCVQLHFTINQPN